MVWSAWRGGPERGRPVWPVWLLASATIFLVGFRIGLNVRGSNVIDVGYSGVVGANRIVNGAVAVRAHAAGGEPEGVRQRGRGRRDPGSDPDERALRVRGRARRHVRAGRLRVVHPRLRAVRLERELGQAACGALRRRSPSTCSRSSAWRCSDAVSEGRGSQRRSRSRGPRTRSRSTCRARTRTTRSCPCS